MKYIIILQSLSRTLFVTLNIYGSVKLVARQLQHHHFRSNVAQRDKIYWHRYIYTKKYYQGSLAFIEMEINVTINNNKRHNIILKILLVDLLSYHKQISRQKKFPSTRKSILTQCGIKFYMTLVI